MSIKNLLDNRSSIREYSDKQVEQDLVIELLNTALKSASSINGQQVSVVVTRDKDKLKRISEVNWNQQHILTAPWFVTFVIDFNRPKTMMTQDMVIIDDLESVIAGSVDAAIVAQSFELLCLEQNIGCCYIGGIRNDMVEMREILGLTGLTIPVFGMTIGYKEHDNTVRPKAKNKVFVDLYNQESVEEDIKVYEQELNQWWEDQGIEDYRKYSQSMNYFYSRKYIPEIIKQLNDCGFLK